MGQVLTNNTALSYAREESPGVLPITPIWKQLEPNERGEFGATLDTVAREPISPLGQDRASTPTALTANSNFDADLTMDSALDFAEAFVYALATNQDMTFRGAPTTATGYTIPAATAAQAAKFQFIAGGPISLVNAAGYVAGANNSPQTVKPLSADVLVTDTEIPVAGLVVEGTPPTNAEVSMAGIRAEAGDLAFAVSANIGTLSSGNNGAVNNIDFTTLGWTPGQQVHIGGLTATNRFGSTASGGPNDSYGGARLRTISAGSCTFDKLSPFLTASDGTDTGAAGTLVPVDLLYGRFVRNVPTDSAEYATITYTFEGSYPNLFETDPPTPVASPDGFEYVTAAQANEAVIATPLTDKATIAFTFLARDAEPEVDNASRKVGASTPLLPLFVEPFNTTLDYFRLGIFNVDDTGLTTDFQDTTFTLSNNVSGSNALGKFGPRFINKGNFQMRLETDAYFTSAGVTAAIRNNTTVTANMLLRNLDGALCIDVPSAKPQGGQKGFPLNETVTINLALQAFIDPTFQTSIGWSFFPVYPADSKELFPSA